MGGTRGAFGRASRLLAALAMLSLAAAPVVLAGEGGSSEDRETTRDCLTGTEVGGLLCVEVTVSGSVSCVWVTQTEAECTGDVEWSYQAESLALPGESEWVGNALIEFCPPGELCRGVGVGFPYTACTWEPASEGCSDARTYELSTSSWALDAGECLEPTLSVWARGHAYTPDKATMGPVISPETEATAATDERICA